MATSQLFFRNLPDGITTALVARSGGLYLAGFDSRRRECLVLFAPPFGQPLRTVTVLPYRDYGRYVPTVLAAADPDHQDHLLVLLYLHPDNLGRENMTLFRVATASGTRTLLSASTAPSWPPTAMVPRPGGKLLVPLAGLGPMLVYQCGENDCASPAMVDSTASRRRGKGGAALVNDTLCLVVGLDPVLKSHGQVVCEGSTGELVSLPSVRNPTLLSVQPSTLHRDRPTSVAVLWIVALSESNEWGFRQGSIYALARRAGGERWEPPRLVVSSVSNPSGAAVDAASGRLYVVEQNTLTGNSYRSFHGDVLSFCSSGAYDCSAAQNSGECACATGFGGECCDVSTEGSFVPAALDVPSLTFGIGVLFLAGGFAAGWRKRQYRFRLAVPRSRSGLSASSLAHLGAPLLPDDAGAAPADLPPPRAAARARSLSAPTDMDALAQSSRHSTGLASLHSAWLMSSDTLSCADGEVDADEAGASAGATGTPGTTSTSDSESDSSGEMSRG